MSGSWRPQKSQSHRFSEVYFHKKEAALRALLGEQSQSHRFSEVYFHRVRHAVLRELARIERSQSHRFSEVYFHHPVLRHGTEKTSPLVAIPSL